MRWRLVLALLFIGGLANVLFIHRSRSPMECICGISEPETTENTKVNSHDVKVNSRNGMVNNHEEIVNGHDEINSLDPTVVTRRTSNNTLSFETGYIINNLFYQNDISRLPKRYTPPLTARTDTIGKTMNVSNKLLSQLHIPLTDFINLTEDNVREVVFVTGASSNHFNESKDTIGSLHTFMFSSAIYYYDLGLTEDQVEEVKKMCNIRYRYFNFSIYPPHVRNLKVYAWKPIIFHEMLSEHHAVIWLDSSVRLTSNFVPAYPHVLRNDGFLFLNMLGVYTNYPVTAPELYQYVPTDIERQKHVYQFGTGGVFLCRTESMYTNLVYWWILCALDEDCQAPPGAQIPCNFHGDKATQFAGCHRYDQSVLNLLVSNYFGYNHWTYGLHFIFIRIARETTTKYKIKRHCPTNVTLTA